MVKWQRAQRLVGSSNPGWIVDHVILDSLVFTRVLPARPSRVLDLGSGAGIPGVPLKIVLPEAKFTLLEAREKRVSFLSAVVRELGLRDCEVLHARLESVVPQRRGQYDAVVTRCAGERSALYETARPLLHHGGVMVASGPPERRPVGAGEWREVETPIGRRLFWLSKPTQSVRPGAENT